MDSKVTVPECVCRDEVVDYMASHYSITPQQVIIHFMIQERIINDVNCTDMPDICFKENEMAILRDMGIRPSCVEFVESNE